MKILLRQLLSLREWLIVPNLLVCPQAALMYCHEAAQVGVISS